MALPQILVFLILVTHNSVVPRRSSARRRTKASRRRFSNQALLALERDPKTGVLVEARASDKGAPLRHQHRGGIEIVDREIVAGGRVVGRGAIARGENVISWLVSQGKLGQDRKLKKRLNAVDWARTTFQSAKLSVKMTASYEVRSPGGGLDLSPKVIAARARWARMYDRLGPELAKIIEDVVCRDAFKKLDVNHICEALDSLARWRRL